MDVVVIGGGIAGLVAARELDAAGARVTVVESSDRWGGALHTVSLDGVPVDVGAEAIHHAASGPLDLIEELGLTGALVGAAAGPTWILSRGRVRPLPSGFGPTGPSRIWPLARSRVLSPVGLVRAGLEPLVPQRLLDEDISVGDHLEQRFGPELVTRLVDPLLGGLHAGDVHRLSLEATTPRLAELARAGRSLALTNHRQARSAGSAGGFVSLRGGMRVLVDRLVADLPSAALRLASPATALTARRDGYVLTTPTGVLHADAVVVAVPAGRARPLLAGLAPGAADGVARQRSASVAVVACAYPDRVREGSPMLAGTGLLVGSGEGRLLKAATFLSSKWPHLADGERFLLRLSAGRVDDPRIDRLDDHELVEALHGELAEITGIRERPEATVVRRFPSGIPQLEVGHARALQRLRLALEHDHPDVVLAGGSYDGLGISACMSSGARAAAQLMARHEDERVAT